MAAICPDARRCCSWICVAVAPQTTQAIAAAPHVPQSLAVAPGQMVFMTPLPQSYSVVPTSTLQQGSSAELEALGIGQQLPVGFMSKSVAEQTMQRPGQFCMEMGWGFQPNLQHEDGLSTAWSGDVTTWNPVATTDRKATEQWSMHGPEEENTEASIDADAWGISRSTLRNRRRQRAAARAADTVSGEQEVKPLEEQSLELLTQVRAGGEASRFAVARFRRLAFNNQDSSRLAQLVLEEASPNEAVILLKGLRGHVREALKSMHCNYVIQRAVELLPNDAANFIPQELLGIGKGVARHRFGCRILCRLLEHGSLEEVSKNALLKEVLADTADLSCHAFGNFVIRHCLEFGDAWHRHAIAVGLCATNLVETAKDLNGSHVVESAVQFCETADKQTIADALLSDPDQLFSLATDNYGRHAIKALLRTRGLWQEQIAAILRPFIHALKGSRQGKPVLQALRAFDGNQANVI